MFDKLLLVSCICIVVASLFYFFYWNRFLGFLIGRVIRLLSWNKEASSIWVEIGSIHFSIIAGRILFKDVKYYSSNQTIKVVKGQIQWRYWIRQPTSEDEIGLYRIGEDAHSPSKRCRVQLSLQGLEWFLYNRTAAYDYIISRMQEEHAPDAPTEPLSQKASRGASSTPFPQISIHKSRLMPRWMSRAFSWMKQQLPNLDPKDLLPLGIEVQKGAIICGNASTANLLVSEFQRSEGTFGVVEARSKLDLYKQILSIKFHQAQMQLVENDDYVDPMASLGELANGRIHQYSIFSHPFSYLSHRPFVKLWDRLGLFGLTKNYARERQEARYQRRPSHSRARRMFGKSSHSESTADHTMLEYAIERKILETPVLELTYYYDTAGEILHAADENTAEDTPPEWGFNIAMTEAIIRYGPWADRQRAEIQRIFFPLGYQDAVVTKPPEPGDTRQWASLQIFLEFIGGATLHIPFREASKDWQWDEQSGLSRQHSREPATIHLSAGDRTTMKYTLPMIVEETGYNPIMDLHLDNILMTSTLNDIRLVASDACRVHGEFPSPLRWDEERTWSIAVSFFKPTLYIIRDHINMFTDLIKDWTAGPPTDYQRFVPTIYAFQFNLHNYDINLYVNDHNIIDKPLFREENALITVSGAHLNVLTDIFSNQYRPDSTSVPFFLDAPDVSLNLSLPRWNTNAMYDGKGGNDIARIGDLHLEGYYRYFAVVRNDAIEQLNLQFKLKHVAFKALGWAIRYFMVLRENYFGSFTNFSTLYEYLEKRRLKIPVGDPVIEKYRPGKSNMLQVEIQLTLENGTVLLPASLTGSDSLRADNPRIGPCLVLTVPEIQIQLRIHDYYMDMSMNTSGITGGILTQCSGLCRPRRQDGSMRVLQIDGIHITANRLFGPAPQTSTYVCIWEIAVDHVQAIPSASDARTILAALDAFRINYSDPANAPAQEYSPDIEPDVTFVRVAVRSLNVTWLAGRAALIFSLPSGLEIGSNDLGGRYHRKVTNIRIPQISLQVLLTTAAYSDRSRWLEAARFTCDIFLDIYRSPADLEEAARLQAEYLRSQDILTGRSGFMGSQLVALRSRRLPVLHKDGLYLPHPALPSRSAGSTAPHLTVKRPSGIKIPVAEDKGIHAESDAEDVHDTAFTAKPMLPRSTNFSRRAKDLNQEMSSGDESDNEDLTDASSDSEWSDAPSPSRLSPDATACRLYSNVLDQYVYQPIHETPGSSNNPSFSLTRRSALLNSLAGTPKLGSRRVPTENDQHQNIRDNNKEVTVFKVKSRKGVDIVLTPLIVYAGVHLEKDVKHSISDAGLWIDSLMVEYISSSKEARSRASAQFDVQLPSISVAILQRIIVDQGRPIISDSPTSTESVGDIGLDVIVVAQAGLEGVDITGHRSDTKTSLTLSSSRCSINLDLSIDKRTITQPKASQFLFGCVADYFKFDMSNGNLGVHWESFDSRLGHLGPEYIIATFVALSSTSKAFANVILPLLKHQSNAKGAVIGHIIQLSAEKAIIDPLSSIQPSYLVQTGRPFSLRIDPIFRFLYHLRACLWHIPLEGNAPPALPFGSDATMADGELLSLVEDRLTALDPEAYSTNWLTSLEKLIPLGHSPTLPQSNHSPFNAYVKLGQTNLTILDPAGRSSSELSVSNLTLRAISYNGELLRQLPNPASLSQTSLRERRHQQVINIGLSVACEDFYLAVFPHLMSFAQNLLRVRRFYYSSKAARSVDHPVSPPPIRSSYQSIVATVHLKRFRIQAAAENLVFELAISQVLAGSNVFNRTQQRNSMTHTVCFDEVSIRARSPSDRTTESSQDILAYTSLIGGKVNIGLRTEASQKTMRIFFTTGLQLSVPRSALKLYRFIEEWRADYLPGMEAMIHALVAELDNTPSTKPNLAPSNSPPVFEVQGHFSHLGISLQVMHGTWLSWIAGPSVVHAKASVVAGRAQYVFGSQIGPMAIEVSSEPAPSEATAGTRIKLSLPPLMATARYDGRFVYIMGLVEEIDIKVKLSHWDTLLVVQQKFGQDFNDLIALVHKTRSSRHFKRVQYSDPNPPEHALKYGGFLKIRGFRLALEGPASTAYLECLDIGGGINNETGRKWNINLSDLALSLAAHNTSSSSRTELSRTHRPAFVTMDISTRGGEKVGDGSSNRTISSVQITVTRLHAVMQPSSIGQLGDFLDYLQVEILARKEQRVMELAAFKDKTRSILKTFEVGAKDLRPVQSSWLDRYVINVSARSIGVAFPLSPDVNPGSTSRPGRKSATIPAFLWTIKSIDFNTHHAETGYFTMKGFVMQFVPRFTQTDPSDYTAEKHKTRNQLIYPEMEAQLKSTHTTSSRQISIGANVSGFILDLDSNIPNYVFSLIDVYRLGKERVDKLSASLPQLLENEQRLPVAPIRRSSTGSGFSSSNISGSLIFASGKVRLYNRNASKQWEERSSRLRSELSDEQVMTELGADVFNLPVVSLWTEYSAKLATDDLEGSEGEASLMFKATIHSSQNILRPNLLPFMTETVNHIESRMRRQNSTTPTPITLVETPIAPDTPVLESAPSSLRISFSLRIDQSKLELTCQPDVNVVAGLHWNSGGFIVNVSPGAQEISFTGAVGGLTVGLKHGFLSEDCVKLDARNLAFSLGFTKGQTTEGLSPHSISVVIETEFLGGVRFSRLQDILCFKAVWLDRIPIFNGQSSGHSREVSRTPITPRPPPLAPKQVFNTVVLVRIRQIMLEVDLGQSISLLTLDLQDATLRTKLTDQMNEVSVSVDSFALNAKGNVAGQAHVRRCVFETTRSNSWKWKPAGRAAEGKMLKLHMTSGPLVVSLESDHQQLLHYRAEPLQVNISDDWSVKRDSINTRETPLQLSFTVDSPEIVATATIGTIPKLLAYVNKFQTNLETQRQGAARESKTFRITRTPKPDNPLSAVAEAMLHSARSRFKEMGSGLSYVILQNMSLHLDMLRLIVFPRTMDDLEIAHFVGRDVKARFDRLVESDEPSGKRDLLLSFSSISISKHSGLGHPPPVEATTKDEWLASLLSHSSEAIIVGLPSMDMHMVSEEIVEEQTRVLLYDFHSKFVRNEGLHEEKDIYITLNMSLYSWLTLLRKSLTREMDQVRTASDWTSMLNTTPLEASRIKKAVPEPLTIVDTPTSTPENTSNPEFSPFSPTTALRSSTGLSPGPLSGAGIFSAGVSPRHNTMPSMEMSIPPPKNSTLVYRPRTRHIERLRMRQLGEATPDVMHPFFMKKAGFNLEDSLPQYVNEYATVPLEEIMEFLLKVYSRQLLANH